MQVSTVRDILAYYSTAEFGTASRSVLAGFREPRPINVAFDLPGPNFAGIIRQESVCRAIWPANHGRRWAFLVPR